MTPAWTLLRWQATTSSLAGCCGKPRPKGAPPPPHRMPPTLSDPVSDTLSPLHIHCPVDTCRSFYCPHLCLLGCTFPKTYRNFCPTLHAIELFLGTVRRAARTQPTRTSRSYTQRASMALHRRLRSRTSATTSARRVRSSRPASATAARWRSTPHSPVQASHCASCCTTATPRTL